MPQVSLFCLTKRLSNRSQVSVVGNLGVMRSYSISVVNVVSSSRLTSAFYFLSGGSKIHSANCKSERFYSWLGYPRLFLRCFLLSSVFTSVFIFFFSFQLYTLIFP